MSSMDLIDRVVTSEEKKRYLSVALELSVFVTSLFDSENELFWLCQSFIYTSQ